jgi:hypothetical protein
MSVDNKEAIHDNRGNTYNAPISLEVTEKDLLVTQISYIPAIAQ